MLGPQVVEYGLLVAENVRKEAFRLMRIYIAIAFVLAVSFLATTCFGIFLAPFFGIVLPTLYVDLLISVLIVFWVGVGASSVDMIQEVLPPRLKSEVQTFMTIGNAAMLLGVLLAPLIFASNINVTLAFRTFLLGTAMWYVLCFLKGFGLVKQEQKKKG